MQTFSQTWVSYIMVWLEYYNSVAVRLKKHWVYSSHSWRLTYCLEFVLFCQSRQNLKIAWVIRKRSTGCTEEQSEFDSRAALVTSGASFESRLSGGFSLYHFLFTRLLRENFTDLKKEDESAAELCDSNFLAIPRTTSFKNITTGGCFLGRC